MTQPKTSFNLEEELERALPASCAPHGDLRKAALYALHRGGKRLRPQLTLATAASFGVPPPNALTPACSVEFIHIYSLIHDDLPCMDDDDMRHGKPTLHKAFPEGLAVLAGDFFLARAFELITDDESLSPTLRCALLKNLATSSGGAGMIGGQVLDVFESGDIELAYRLKTGKLFSCALEMGGLIAGLKDKDLQTLREIGHVLGVAYQIHNDARDPRIKTTRSTERASLQITRLIEALPPHGQELDDLLSLILKKF